MIEMRLKKEREKSLLRKHLWIFSGAVEAFSDSPECGETVRVTDHSGKFLAYAACSPQSQLIGRVWSFNENMPPGKELFQQRIREAAEFRRFLGLDDPEGGCRLINSEADGLPGLVVDRFGEFLVMQISAAGVERFREEFVELLMKELGAKGIYERSDLPVRAKEGLAERTGLAAGEQPPNPIIIRENGMRFAVDVRHGQKSGFYFDQRESRRAVAKYADRRTVLNCFSYTGGFAVAALKAGAKHVINVDSSSPALRQAAHNLEMNKINKEQFENVPGDVFEILRQYAAEKRKFDMVILDPPKFVDSQRNLTRGCRAYQDIARLGFQLLNPGGLLFNFSCSGLMTPELFQKITADAALAANTDGTIVEKLHQSPDHNIPLSTPETFYLKGLITRIK
ncbi:MAG: class I SAM-dependent methyltransferase [Lentisphaeria bacterium]|nr:class I SAM-dependent methyltransferase [Lentisphaeria bacterium]